MAQLYCEKCRRTMQDTNFYQYKDGKKAELCKNCMTMHINNFDPETFLWLLEKFDVPYIEGEWNILRDKAYAKDPYKMTGMSVFGKYLSKMQLKQWRNYTWADTERLKEEAEAQMKLREDQQAAAEQDLDAMREKYENGEINEAQYKTYVTITAPPPAPPEPAQMSGNNPYPINESPFEEVELVDVGAELTAEDKIYLAMKWGRLYSAADWVYLEELYTKFMNSFDIQGAAREDNLRFICKTSLKMNQAIDAGDIDTYQKLSRVYDTVMKQGKFTEAQNKEEKKDFVDSVGELVAYCEKEGGFIPRFCINIPQDIVDITLQDMNNYTRKLIEQDSALAQQIEMYIKKKEVAEANRVDEAVTTLYTNSENPGLTDEDYQEYYKTMYEEEE